ASQPARCRRTQPGCRLTSRDGGGRGVGSTGELPSFQTGAAGTTSGTAAPSCEPCYCMGRNGWLSVLVPRCAVSAAGRGRLNHSCGWGVRVAAEGLGGGG